VCPTEYSNSLSSIEFAANELQWGGGAGWSVVQHAECSVNVISRVKQQSQISIKFAVIELQWEAVLLICGAACTTLYPHAQLAAQ
jgi:hypothetical protein